MVEPALGDVLDAGVELSRRFIVGRSESSLDAWLAVPDVVESVLPFVCVVAGLLWSLVVAGAASPLVFVTRWGRFGSVEAAVITGRVLDDFKAVAVLLGAARGLTLP